MNRRTVKAGVDIGGTKIRIGLLGENNTLIADSRIEVSSITDPADAIRSELFSLCEKTGITLSDIVSLGVGIPGTVSADGRKILKAPNISVLTEDFAGNLEKATGIPVTMMQDSRAAAWGEYLCGAGKNAQTLVCITLGTGIGTGIVIGGKVYHGALRSAGEIGHIPVVGNGRECGCGKRGCLEKYAAGRGLDITAAELLGEGKTAPDLFEAAKNGHEEAKKAISEAVVLLGNAVTGIVNLLSPDKILFSGGLSLQKELYLEPLIGYIRSHCYSSGRLPEIGPAGLGEDAPLIGAALIPSGGKAPEPVACQRKPKLAASLMCADTLNLGKALNEIENAGMHYIHCDIMDNHFVPNLMLPPELINRLHDSTSLPFDYHIMTENPATVIERLDIREGDLVSVHVESTVHLERVVAAILARGGKAAVALNPATPIESVREILGEVSMVLMMTVNPGFSGQKLVPGSFDKIRRMREYLDALGYSDLPIEVDGNCSFENVPKMAEAGAEIFVVGTSSVFAKGLTVAEGTEKLMNLLK